MALNIPRGRYGVDPFVSSRDPAGAPAHGRATVVLTFDNLGEAAELESETWPIAKPLGQHISVTEALPRILNTLAERKLHATFFVEGWNTAVYPRALRAIVAAGHELGLHGWRHEPWRELRPAKEAELLAKGVHAFREIGLEVRGFRPPGGLLTSKSQELLPGAGFTFCSPAGRLVARVNELAVVPYAWDTVDAYYYNDDFAGLRRKRGDGESVLAPSVFRRRVQAAVAMARDEGEHVCLVLHPFLENEPEHFSVLCEILDFLARTDDVSCIPAGELASWILASASSFVRDPKLDTLSWS